jgi:hypothetical protein
LRVAEVFAYGPDEDARSDEGAEAARRAFAAARRGGWEEAVRLYAEAVRVAPGRLTYHAAWSRARWRAGGRRQIDVESLDDGGPGLVERR